MKRAAPVLIICAVLVVALLSFFYLRRPATPTNSSPRLSPRPIGQPKLGAEPPHTLGNIDAVVLLEEFGDFECSPCATIYPVLKKIKQEFGSDVVIVFRQFPLVGRHAQALEAARAAEAAALQGKFWQMHDLLYENQQVWRSAADPQALFVGYATTLNLNVENFNRDRSSESVNQRINLDRERGRWIGVNSTPTVFLNGQEVPADSLNAAKLSDLIRAELAAAKRK